MNLNGRDRGDLVRNHSLGDELWGFSAREFGGVGVEAHGEQSGK